MARRSLPKSKPLQDLFAVAVHMPWWLSLVLAAMAYLLLSAMAAPPAVVPGRAADAATGAVFRGAATLLQYVLPALLLAASVGAFLRAGREPPAPPVSELWPRRESAPRAAAASTRPPEPRPASDVLDEIAKRRSAAAAPAQPTEWSMDVLRRMDWKHLELVAAAYFEKICFKAVTQESGADGGIDIRLYRGEGPEPFAIVQCKSRSSQPLGVAHARELLGVMTHTKVSIGVLLCSSGFTGEAEAFAKSNRIALESGATLLAKIQALPAEAQAELLKIATAGDWTTPTCASCGTKMLLRQSQRGPFWGCRAYPRCKNRMQLSREQRAGVAA